MYRKGSLATCTRLPSDVTIIVFPSFVGVLDLAPVVQLIYVADFEFIAHETPSIKIFTVVPKLVPVMMTYVPPAVDPN